MKRIIVIGILISLFCVSCNETSTSVFTVQQEEVTSTANGTMIVYIDQEGEPFKLAGHLKLVEGECLVQLYAPVSDTIFDFDTAYSLDETKLPDMVLKIDSIYIANIEYISELVYEELFTTPADVVFDKKFDRILGEWLFTYNLNAVDQIQPFGNFEFTITYND